MEVTASTLLLFYGCLFHLQLTSQDHTPKVIQRALGKHNMDDVSCHEFSLCQMLNNGKGKGLSSSSLVFSECRCNLPRTGWIYSMLIMI